MHITEELKSAIAAAAGVTPEEVRLEHPDVEGFGDYSTNIALLLKGGRKLAEEIAQKIKADDMIAKVEVAGPGFINFILSDKYLIEEMRRIIVSGDEYGLNDTLKGRKIMVEFAHPNTHKELHIGHMRTLITGEALARIFENAGARVFRANYQGDIGPHVAKAIWGTMRLLEDRHTTWETADRLDAVERAHLLGEGYVLGNRMYEEKKSEMDDLNSRIYAGDRKITDIYTMTRRWSLEYYDLFYKRFGTRFDRFFFESEVAGEAVRIIRENLNSLKTGRQVFEESQGAVIFDGEKYGLHKRVFITGDGHPTYEGKDMALAYIQRKDFPFDRNIHVVANEQTGYFQVIFKALEILDPDFAGREYHLPMGMVNLIGRKMSSRTGEIMTVDGLLSEVKAMVGHLINTENKKPDEIDKIKESVTLAAVKYSVLKVHPTLNVAFDVKQSVNLEGNSGPYLQYTYARTVSVLRKAVSDVINYGLIDSYTPNKEELHILHSLYKYPEIGEEAALRNSPNLICNYLHEISQGYNTFYNQHSILSADNEAKIAFRISLTKAVGQIIRNGLEIVGIDVLDRM